MGTVRAWLAAAGCSMAICSAALAQDTGNARGGSRVSLARGPQNHLVMTGTVNGRPATFLIDSGADISFLRADRAAEFGVRALAAQANSSGRTFRLGAVEDLRGGGVRLGTSTFALYEAAQFRGHVPGQRGRPADGVIGLDILRRHRAVIHCRAREIIFNPHAAGRQLVSATRAAGFTQIPLTATRRGHLTVPCVINGRNGRLVVDTGAFVTGLDDDAARSLGLMRQPTSLTTRGFEGRIRPLELTQVDDLRIGAVRIAPQPFAVIDLFPKKRQRRTTIGLGRIVYYTPLQVPRQGPIFGLLGNELLDQRHAIIDLGSMSLFLK